MRENDATTTELPQELLGDITTKALWFVVASMTIGIFVLIETLLLNRGCTL